MYAACLCGDAVGEGNEGADADHSVCLLLQTCQNADAAVVFIGSSMIENDKSADGSLRPAHEGEGLDRNNLDLPGRQADLARALARRAPGLPVIVVLFNGGGLDVGWIDRMPAVSAMLAVGFPGQVGATMQLYMASSDLGRV
jgi:beta-glucosidase